MNARFFLSLCALTLLGAACNKSDIPAGYDYRQVNRADRKELTKSAYMALLNRDESHFLSLLSPTLRASIVQPDDQGARPYDKLLQAALDSDSDIGGRMGILRFPVSDNIAEKIANEYLPSFEFVFDLRFNNQRDVEQDKGYRIKIKSVPVSDEVYKARAENFQKNVPQGDENFLLDQVIGIAIDKWEIAEITPLESAPIGNIREEIRGVLEPFVSFIFEEAETDEGYERLLGAMKPALREQFSEGSDKLKTLDKDLGLNLNASESIKLFEQYVVRNPRMLDSDDKSFGDKVLAFEMVKVYVRKDDLEFQEHVIGVEVSVPNNEHGIALSAVDASEELLNHGLAGRHVKISDYKKVPIEESVLNRIHFQEGQREALEDIMKLNQLQKKLFEEEKARRSQESI